MQKTLNLTIPEVLLIIDVLALKAAEDNELADKFFDYVKSN
jgi:hypothetical protein